MIRIALKARNTRGTQLEEHPKNESQIILGGRIGVHDAVETTSFPRIKFLSPQKRLTIVQSKTWL